MTDQKTLYNCTVEEFVLLWWRVTDEERAAFVQRVTDDPDASADDQFKLGLTEDFADIGKDDDELDLDGPPPPPEASPFPVSALPEWARAFVEELAKQNQTPIDLPAQVALGAISAVANRGRSTVHIGGGWTEGPNLYLAIAMPPGAGKSPVMNALLDPVEEIERLSVEAHDDERRMTMARIVALDKRVKELQKQIEGTDDAGDVLNRDYVEAVKALEIAKDSVNEGRILADDTTPEALVRLLHRNGGTISLISTEGGLFDNLGRYAERGTPPNLDGLLKIWSGDNVRVDRASGDRINLIKPRATVCITVQPSVVAKVMGNGEFVGRGLVARFMISQPASYVGRRNMMALADLPGDAVNAWRDGLMRLHQNQGKALAFTLDARAAFLAFRQSLEERRFIGGDLEYPTLTEMSTKCESSVARTALLLALCEGSDTVELGHINRAILLGHYWITQAILLGGEAVLDYLSLRVKRFVEWCERRGGEVVSVRDVNRGGVFRRMGADDAESIVEVFDRAAELGHGTVDWTGKTAKFVPRAVRQTRDARATCSTVSDRPSSDVTESAATDAQSDSPKDSKRAFSLSIPTPTPLPPESVRLRASCSTESEPDHGEREPLPEPDPDDEWNKPW
jgi:hypothetical protein